MASKINKFGYAELEGKMLDVSSLYLWDSKSACEDAVQTEDADYPLMFIER